MSYSYRNTHPTGSCEPLQYSKLFICHGLDVSELLHEQRLRNHLRLWHCHLPGSLPSPHTCPSTPALPQAHQPFPILIQGIYPTRFSKSFTVPRSVHSHPPPKTGLHRHSPVLQGAVSPSFLRAFPSSETAAGLLRPTHLLIRYLR